MPHRHAIEIVYCKEQDVLYRVTRKSIDSNPETIPQHSDTQALIQISFGQNQVESLLSTLQEARHHFIPLVEAKARDHWSRIEVHRSALETTLIEAQGLLSPEESGSQNDSILFHQPDRRPHPFLEASYESPEFGEGADLILGDNLSALKSSDRAKSLSAFRLFIRSACLALFLSPIPPGPRQRTSILLIPGISCIEKGIPEASLGFHIILKESMSLHRLKGWMLLANLWGREKAVFDLRWKERENIESLHRQVVVHEMGNMAGGILGLAHNCLEDLKEHNISVPSGFIDSLQLLRSDCALGALTVDGLERSWDENPSELEGVTCKELEEALQGIKTNQRLLEIDIQASLINRRIPKQLFSVVAELVRNALKASRVHAPHQPIHIKLDSMENGRFLSCEVINRGSLGQWISILNDPQRSIPEKEHKGCWLCSWIVHSLGGQVMWEEMNRKGQGYVRAKIGIPFMDQGGKQ